MRVGSGEDLCLGSSWAETLDRTLQCMQQVRRVHPGLWCAGGHGMRLTALRHSVPSGWAAGTCRGLVALRGTIHRGGDCNVRKRFGRAIGNTGGTGGARHQTCNKLGIHGCFGRQGRDLLFHAGDSRPLRNSLLTQCTELAHVCATLIGI
ncbi:hypothetical protein XEU66b_19145 [Xanthomonas euvesicatoria]|nr:hypothetical protein BJD11_00510 [Xanthomonas euvesicatoria]KHL56728.1 hypothetical protein XEU66b_19145 [Xanthomonas euvesicatoria]